MGNKWELQNSKSSLIKVCPCGNGGYILVEKEYQDDYLRNHTSNERYCDCNECDTKYEYYFGHWIKKDDFVSAKEMEDDIKLLKNQIYIELYNEHFEYIIDYFKTKKALYDFLYKNRLFNVPGTIQTFYKNGINSYITSGKNSFPGNVDHLIKLIDSTVGLSNSDNSFLMHLRGFEQNFTDFITNHSVKTF